MESNLCAYFITEDNLEELTRAFDPELLHRTSTCSAKSLEVNLVLVIQTINDHDIFDSRFGTRAEHYWITTHDEFSSKFKIIENGNRTETFAQITKK